MKRYIKSALRALSHPIADLVGAVLVCGYSVYMVFCLESAGVFSRESAVCGAIAVIGISMLGSFIHRVLFRC